MKLGRVTGAVWATKKCPALAGQIFMRVACGSEEIVAADFVGAGEDDRVIVTFGSAARWDCACPIDAAIIAILDEGESQNGCQ